jgi:hypothetical protein
VEQTVILFPNSPWSHWLKELMLLKGPKPEPSQSTFEARQALNLALNQPDALPTLLASALQQNDCASAQEIWKTIIPFALATELDPAQWCGVKKGTPTAGILPAKLANRYLGLRWLIDLTRFAFQ